MKTAWKLPAVLAGLALLGACGAGGSTRADAHDAPSHASTSRSPAPAGTAPAPARTASEPGSAAQVADITKLLVFVVENHSLDQMRADMPYTFGLARRYGYATGYRAVVHPSLPNYLAITGGSTFGVTDDDSPEVNRVEGPSVFRQALAAGKSAGVYAEDMPGPCATEDAGDYAVKHNPWAYYLDERDACRRYDVPLPRLAADTRSGELPNAGMVIPDLCNDAHNCDLSRADGWLRDRLSAVMDGRDWKSGRLVIVVTADEDDHDQGNLVLTAVLHPSLHGVVADRPLTHYSLTRLYDEVLGTPLLRQAAQAPSMLDAFGLELTQAGR